jgi:hypothetical protein
MVMKKTRGNLGVIYSLHEYLTSKGLAKYIPRDKGVEMPKRGSQETEANPTRKRYKKAKN